MIVEAADLTETELPPVDVCIVGAGAAGIAIALCLGEAGRRVLVLESGGIKHEASSQALYEGHVVDERLHSPLHRYRERRFGGTTTIWGGRCIPFDPIDFEARPYMADSGWPIAHSDLIAHYREANRLCEAGDFAYTRCEGLPEHARSMIDGFASQHFTTDTLERFSCPTDFGARYGHKLRANSNIQVLLHANAAHVQLDPTGRSVDSIRVRTLSGKSLLAKARRFVLAAGGLESARILLLSRDVHRDGIGNQHDCVGRYYMCHLAGTIGTIRVRLPLGAVHHGYDISDEGIYCRQRIALRAEVQRERQLGNFIARLHHPRITDPAHRNPVLSLLCLARFLIPYEYGKRLHGEESLGGGTWLRHCGNVLADPLDAAAFAWHMFRDRMLAERKFPSIIIRSKANLFSLDFHAEQRPVRISRVRLAADRDALGLERLQVDWRYAPEDVDSVRRSIALLAQDLKARGAGEMDYDPDKVEFEMVRYGAYGGHHIGTARMGTDPRTSVVDPHCRVHGVDNLFVAGAAVFPTSSQANPTLTVVALALRLAQHLRSLQ